MSINYRRFEMRDRMPVYQMFRESIWDYMLDQNMMSPEDGQDLDDYFSQQQGLYVHLEEQASEDWVAEDENQTIVGWARSIERDNHLQLTHFFVSTSTQGSGIGRSLLDRAFPVGRGEQRSIIATINPRALSLYLRYDVSVQGLAFNFYGPPHERELDTDLEINEMEATAETVAIICQIDQQVLGYSRPADIEFLMTEQPVYLFYRQGKPVAYAFCYGNHSTGPAAALSPDDLPVVLQQIEQTTFAAGAESMSLVLPAAAHNAVKWALDAGYRIDPFHEFLLAKEPTLQFDRYLITGSSFIL